jgi:hypothetical protein
MIFRNDIVFIGIELEEWMMRRSSFVMKESCGNYIKPVSRNLFLNIRQYENNKTQSDNGQWP